VQDGFGFFAAPIHVSREEAKELMEKILEITMPYRMNELTSDRQLQSFAMIITPPAKP